VSQGQITLDDKITDVRDEVNNINDNINSMERESARTADATDSKLNKMLVFMMRDTTSAAAAPASAAPAAPVSAPAPIPQHQPPRSSLNPSASPFLAPTSLASSLPASSVAPDTAPTSSVVKDTFKTTKRDKAASEDVYTFAENFYKVTKEKSNENINNALVSLCSVDQELGKFLSAQSSNGPTQWHIRRMDALPFIV
jgi:hypothetical protein